VSRHVRLRGADMAALCLLVVVQSAAFSLIGYHKFTQRVNLTPREWDVLQVLGRLGRDYDYFLFTGPLLLADSPIFQLFSTGTRAVSGFTGTDVPDRLVRDTAFVLTPEFRRVGVTISERFPGAEREVVDQSGVRQVVVYRCSAENGCRRGQT
jgi:hypothetical protein